MKSMMGIMLLLAAAGWNGACRSSADALAVGPLDVPDVFTGDRVTLAVNQSGRLPSGVVVRVDSIYDNRCPINANCISSGLASAKLLVSRGTDQTVARLIVGRLVVQGSGTVYQDSTGARLGGQTYKIILRDVTPFPEIWPTSEPKRAVVQVTAM